MNDRHIELNTENGICRIRLNRPEKQNALDASMIASLTDIVKQLAHDNSVRIIVFEGNGKSFCAGADLNWFLSSSHPVQEKEKAREFAQLGKLLFRISKLPQPTIALAKGNIFGGGIGLMAACDFVLMENSSKLAFSEVKLGLVPAMIMPFVAERINRQWARQLMLTGKHFDAEKAQWIGLADQLFSKGQEEDLLASLIAELSDAAPEAINVCKKLISKVYSEKLTTRQTNQTAQIVAKRIASEEAQQRITAFVDKK